jgi:hypothetical protein
VRTYPVKGVEGVGLALLSLAAAVEWAAATMQPQDWAFVALQMRDVADSFAGLYVEVPDPYGFDQWVADVTDETQNEPEAFGADFLTLLDIMVGANE